MKVIAYDKFYNNRSKFIIQIKSLSELLTKSDIVTIHVPFDESTKKMLGKEEFSQIKKGAIIVNTSRGEIIDETELLDAIKSRHISGAILDVLENEIEFQNNAILNQLIEFSKNDNRLLITPHIGGATFESMEQTEVYMANKIYKYFKEQID